VAVIALLLVWGLEFWSRHFREERPDLYRTNRWALGLILAQALVGGFVVLSRLTLASTLLHAALMALLFAALADGARRTLVQRRVSADIPTPTALGMHAPAR
jgi:heme A synthase